MQIIIMLPSEFKNHRSSRRRWAWPSNRGLVNVNVNAINRSSIKH